MNALTELEQRADTEARHAHRELVEELEAKLAKAVEALRLAVDTINGFVDSGDAFDSILPILAELKGEGR